MLLKLADFYVEYEGIYGGIEKLCRDYEASEHKADVAFKLTEEDISAEKVIVGCKSSGAYLETLAAYRKLANWLPPNDAFLLHSAIFDVSGSGVALAAKSGTGKTTHMLLWKKLLGDKMTVVNGDKPLVRFFDNEQYGFAYGTPWCGKEHLSNNIRTPLKYLCFIERSEDNSVEELPATKAAELLFNQVYMPSDADSLMKTIDLMNRFIGSVTTYKIKCNMEDAAASVAFDKIFGSRAMKG